MARPVNVCERVSVKAGWIAILSGQASLASAITRNAESLNERGYRVVTIIPDQWGFLRHLLNIILSVVTLGLYSQKPGVLIVGEHSE